MERAIGKESNADSVPEPPDRNLQSDRKEGDEDEIKRLSLDAIEETKVLPHALVDGIDGAPPHEFIEGEERRKENHVRRNKGLRDVHSFIEPNQCQNSQGYHACAEEQVENGKQSLDAAALALAGTTCVLVG